MLSETLIFEKYTHYFLYFEIHLIITCDSIFSVIFNGLINVTIKTIRDQTGDIFAVRQVPEPHHHCEAHIYSE